MDCLDLGLRYIGCLKEQWNPLKTQAQQGRPTDRRNDLKSKVSWSIFTIMIIFVRAKAAQLLCTSMAKA